jgi:hypothetical protein
MAIPGEELQSEKAAPVNTGISLIFFIRFQKQAFVALKK